jgi:hypothetical protein
VGHALDDAGVEAMVDDVLGGGDGSPPPGEGDDIAAVPVELLAEVDAAVVDLIEASPRRRTASADTPPNRGPAASG